MSKTETKSTVLLKHHLKALKLPTIHAECERIAERAAADNADHLAFLLQLCELELIERERKAADISTSERTSCSSVPAVRASLTWPRRWEWPLALKGARSASFASPS